MNERTNKCIALALLQKLSRYFHLWVLALPSGAILVLTAYLRKGFPKADAGLGGDFRNPWLGNEERQYGGVNERVTTVSDRSLIPLGNLWETV